MKPSGIIATPPASAFGMDVPSPCIKVCTLDREGVCTGCGRRIEEIAAWPQASDEQRRRIAEAARRRRLERLSSLQKRIGR
ncbi:MAG: DUF1289 domain-containing protein [Nevskia sp.]|nr:DUF1289 domain-containing protein [Nevskia sp.]